MQLAAASAIALIAAVAAPTCSGASDASLQSMVLPRDAAVPADVTNRYADDPSARALGKKLFYDPRFSGPLLDESNNGTSATLGFQGDTGKVACASCHIPESTAFVDVRSSRAQLSLASGWTFRKTPSLLDVAQTKFLNWDGRRDSAFSVVFGSIESSLEFNSSRLFVAQQIARYYRKEYEAIFGPLPSLRAYPTLTAAQAGCTEFPADPVHDLCPVPGATDEAVTRVVVNMGKAIQAFTRTLSCGRSRFDEWMDGDASALTADEQAGARLFVGRANCASCHSGPYLTDQRFHNLGVPGGIVPFTTTNDINDPGAAPATAALKQDWLNSKGRFSDGDDGRLDTLPTTGLLGSFKTPSLRCVSRRPTFMHGGQFRSLEDAVDFFSDGLQLGSDPGYVGQSEISPRQLTFEEKGQLLAFLRALDGTGPDPAALVPPELPK